MITLRNKIGIVQQEAPKKDRHENCKAGTAKPYTGVDDRC